MVWYGTSMQGVFIFFIKFRRYTRVAWAKYFKCSCFFCLYYRQFTIRNRKTYGTYARLVPGCLST